ncbi:putative nicotinate-nucleotide adenylyltransferase [Varanus komodoensis]|nr:putative nicotinate-nucleotide adenylyltransferase [Varanus komodoensis]
MPTSHGAVWTQMELAIERQPCVVIRGKRDKAGVIITVQPHCDTGREDPEVRVPAQQQEQNMSSVTDELQLEWNKHESVPCVQQQTAGKEVPAVCVTVQAQPVSQRDKIQHECVHKYPTSQYEDAPHIMLDHQETQCKEETIAAEVEQQDREEASGKESTPLQQVANDSVIKESLLQQDRWHQSKEYLKLVQFLQADQSGTRLEAVVTEKKFHCDCQDVEPTKTNLCPLGVMEKDTKEMSTKLHQKQACAEGNATHLQPLSLDERAQKVIVQEMKDGRKDQAVTQKPGRDMPNYFVAIPITNDQVGRKLVY